MSKVKQNAKVKRQTRVAKRKEERKNARKSKKQKKNNFNMAKSAATRGAGPFTASSELFSQKHSSQSEDNVERAAEKREQKKFEKELLRKKKEADLKRNEQQMHKTAIEREDKVIKSMEKKLKLNKRRKKNTLPKSFYEEGLGDVLDFLDNRNANDSDDEQPPKKVKAEKTAAAKSDLPWSDDEMSEGEFERDFGGYSDDEQGEISKSKKVKSKPTERPSSEDEGSEEDFGEEFEDEGSDGEDSEQSEEESDLEREDIYGRKLDKKGNVIKEESKRPKVDASANYTPEELNPDLVRRIRGQLNRVTSSNLPGISTFLENLYRSNSFYQMNEGICKCVSDLLVIEVTLSPLKLVEELCLLMATMHENIGEEVGGHCVHYFIKLFNELLTEHNQRKHDDSYNASAKKLDNSVAVLCFMHAVGLLDPQLMFDVIDELVAVFDEKCVELLVFILISVGFLLRKEDPVRMKELVSKTRSKASGYDKNDISGGKRVEFMIETLTLIKNNNLMKISSRSGIVSPIERENLRNVLKNCLKRSTKVNYIPGRFQQVLLSNRWWIKVGTLLELTDSSKEAKKHELKLANDEEFTELDEKLCKALRLNTTPLRKSLFKALISSSDYIEACQRLTSLAKKQFSEVANVVVHVCLSEKNFNQFYVHLLKALATFDRKYKLATQFALRDKITELETLSAKSRANLPQLVFSLIKENVTSINVLKVIEFTDLSSDYVTFLKKIFDGVFAEDDAKIKEILEKIPKKDTFASAIKLFISLYMDKSMSDKSKDIIKTRLRIRDNL